MKIFKSLLVAFFLFCISNKCLAGDFYVSDSLTAANSKVTMAANGYGAIVFQLTGTWSGTVTFEASANGTTWVSTPGFNQATSTGATTTTANGIYTVTGIPKYVRARMSSYTSGTAILYGQSSTETSLFYTPNTGSGGGAASSVDVTSIAAGDNNIGNVDIVTVPSDPFGANADAASATGSISAKLRFIASTGIPITGTVTVGSHAVTNAGTFATQVTSVPADPFGANADAASATGSISAKLRFIASTGIPITGTSAISAAALPLPSGAATSAKQPALGTAGSSSTDVISVQGIASGTALPVSNAGTFATQAAQSGTWTVQPGNTANTTAWKVDNSAVNQPVVGAAAHGASVSGNPVLNGLEARTTDGTVVTSGQVVRAQGTIEGKTVTQPIAIRASTWSSAAAAGGLVTTSGVTAKTAAGAGIRNCVDAAQIINSHQTIGTEVMIRDGASGTVLWRGWAQFTGGGSAQVFQPPLCGTANTLIEIAEVTATTTAGVLVNLQGHITAE